MGKLAEPRIGDKMRMAVWYVYRHPGCAKLPAAVFCAPYAETSSPGTQYGYASVNRALRAGLTAGEWKGNRWSLTLTGKGRALAAEWLAVTP